MLTFTVALIICFALYLFRKEKINRYDCICGVVLGVANYFSTQFLIRSIYTLPAFVAYILFGFGVILFVNIVNVLVLHEQLSKRDYLGMVLAVAAIVLLNI